MSTIPSHYREEVLKPFFNYVKSGESFYLIGAPSVGKTRLVDFVMGDDPDALWAGEDYDRDWVKKKYLGEDIATKIWLVRVDMNNMQYDTDWRFQFYELLLNSILLTCNRNSSMEKIEPLKQELAGLDSQVIQSKDALMAHRLFGMAVNMICQLYGIRLCFLFDEFDKTYGTAMPHETFAQLRAIRDANKYRLSYVLFLRGLPEKLRDPLENEGFFELISRNMLGLGPYSRQDALHIISQLEKRREHTLSKEHREWICTFSGGHPGLIQALFTVLKEYPAAASKLDDVDWFARQEAVREEFRKILEGLSVEEQAALRSLANGDKSSVTPAIGKQIHAKGLIKPTSDHVQFFSPMFGYWLR